MRILFFVVLLLSATSVISQSSEKMKGVSFVASSSPIDVKDVKPIVDINANWVTLMPFASIRDGAVKYDSKFRWWGEKKEGLEETIRLCKKEGLKIMVKPQVWIMNGYTGNYKPKTEEGWTKFEASYRSFIMTFLEPAIEHNVEMFCIGTEWREFVSNRPVFWKSLIKEIRTKFKGELTYAANWDDYEKVPFWKELDYIGIDGYFPISFSSDPSLKELVKGWNVHKNVLAKYAAKFNRKIIFTEIGYRSMIGATVKPWEHGTRAKYSETIQDKAFQALFDVLWNEPWFEGIFIWKWYHNHGSQGGDGDLDFTPQNKKAEQTIRGFWAN